MGALTKGYRDIYKEGKPLLKKTKEFYGLRDFYRFAILQEYAYRQSIE